MQVSRNEVSEDTRVILGVNISNLTIVHILANVYLLIPTDPAQGGFSICAHWKHQCNPPNRFLCLWALSLHIIIHSATVILIYKLICVISLPKILHWFTIAQTIKSKFFNLASKYPMAPIHSYAYILLSQKTKHINTDTHTCVLYKRTYIHTSLCLHTSFVPIEQIVTSLPQTNYVPFTTVIPVSSIQKVFNEHITSNWCNAIKLYDLG